MLILDIDAKVKAWVVSRINIEILLAILCCQAIFLNNYSDGAACALFLLLWAGSFTISTKIYYAIVNMDIKVTVTNYTSRLQFSSKKISSLRAAKLYNSSCSLSHQ